MTFLKIVYNRKRRNVTFSQALDILFHRVSYQGKIIYNHFNLIKYYDDTNISETEIAYTFNYYRVLPNSTNTPVIVDLGSNIGSTVLALKYYYPQSTIHCYEPNPEVFKILKDNIDLNSLNNVFPHRLAVVGKGRKLNQYLYIYSGSTVSSRLRPSNDIGYIKKIKVKVTNFNQIIVEVGNIDLLNVDVEGEEYPLINSIYNNYKHIRSFIIELHPYPYQLAIEKLRLLSKNIIYQFQPLVAYLL